MQYEPKFHAQIYNVEGLNIGKEKFLWNNKLKFVDAGTDEGNIAEAHIFIDKPMREKDLDSFDSGIDPEGILLLSIFLACFRLANRSVDIRLNQKETEGYSIASIEEFKNSEQFRTIHFNSLETDLPTPPQKMCQTALENTIPLFEKVMKNMDFKQSKSKNPLTISLPLFLKVSDEDDLKAIIDFVIVLESLICENENNLKKKIASRTAALIQTSSKDTKYDFEYLKEIYRLRSDILHGSEISLDAFSEEYTDTQMYLKSVVRRALLEYIELIDSGLSKKQIIVQLDSLARQNDY